MWITPSPSDLRTWAFTDAEWTGIGTASLKSGVTATTAFNAAVAAVIRHVVKMVTMSGRPRGADGDIPDEVELEFKALVVREFFLRLPETVSKQFFGDARQQAALRADETLDRLSKTTGGIVPPSAPADDQSPAAAVVTTDLSGAWDAEAMDGL